MKIQEVLEQILRDNMRQWEACIIKFKTGMTQLLELLPSEDFSVIFSEPKYNIRKCVHDFDLGLVERKCDLAKLK